MKNIARKIVKKVLKVAAAIVIIVVSLWIYDHLGKVWELAWKMTKTVILGIVPAVLYDLIKNITKGMN